MTRIDAEVLIPGRGEPIPDGCVVMEGGTITYAGPTADVPATPEAGTYHVPALMPGMWDCHSHFFGTEKADLSLLVSTPTPMTAVRAARDAHTLLMAGFTSTREMGGIGVYRSRLVEEATLVGPSIYAAGVHSRPPGATVTFIGCRSRGVMTSSRLARAG